VGQRFVFVDSDVVLNQDALYHYALAHEKQPKAVIAGPYQWLPPLAIKDDNEHFLWEAKDMGDIIGNILVNNVDKSSPFGDDSRGVASFTDDPTKVGKGAGMGALSGNISYPRDLFLQVGGFDERIVGHGGEDCDLGLTVDNYGVDWVFYGPVIGFHLWHPRNQEANQREVDANIQYIDRKHGVGRYENAKKWSDSRNWADPGHFHKHLSAEVVKTDNDPTVWAVREGRRLGISSEQWLTRLGFSFADVKIIPVERLNEFVEVGSTPDITAEEALQLLRVEEVR
jgi:GT2 family glycosyltransferase